jgi:hypothetical protein
MAKTKKLDDTEKKLQKLQAAFEKKCDMIQKHTEELLAVAPDNNKEKRDEILAKHKAKLQKALEFLKKKLDEIA